MTLISAASPEAQKVAWKMRLLIDHGWTRHRITKEAGIHWRGMKRLLDMEAEVDHDWLNQLSDTLDPILEAEIHEHANEATKRDRDNLARWFIAQGRMQPGQDLMELIKEPA